MLSFILSLFDVAEGASDIADVLREKRGIVVTILSILLIIVLAGISIYFNYKWF